MLIDRASRTESLDYLRDEPGELAVPTFSELPTDPAAITALIDGLKPRRYAATALAMNVLLETVQATPLAEQYDEGPQLYPNDPYRDLRGHALAAFWVAIDAVQSTAEYQQAAEYPSLITRLDPNRAIGLKPQLSAGADTATTSMLTLLRHVPAMLRHHAPDSQFTPDEITEIAKRSVGLPWRMAMMCVNQMLALKSVVTSGDAEYTSWAGSETQLDLNRFKLKSGNGQPALDFDRLEDFELPEGFSVNGTVSPLPSPTTISEIPCAHANTIGCPITLQPRQVNGLWEWFIDGIAQRNMWEQT